jgi:hypothetical protein
MIHSTPSQIGGYEGTVMDVCLIVGCLNSDGARSSDPGVRVGAGFRRYR